MTVGVGAALALVTSKYEESRERFPKIWGKGYLFLKGEGSPLWGNVNKKDTKNDLGLSTGDMGG